MTATLALRAAPQVDVNQDGLPDLWQLRYGAQGLLPTADADGDGLSNEAEARIGSDPFSPSSGLTVELAEGQGNAFSLRWGTLLAKRYVLESSPDLVTWTAVRTVTGSGADATADATPPSKTLFYRVAVSDTDSDGDGLTDWEETSAGYDPARMFSEGLGSNPTVSNPRITDFERFKDQLAVAGNTLSVTCIDSEVAEGWPHPAVAVIRRTGGFGALTVNFSLSGTASAGQDYVAPGQLSVKIPLGADQAIVSLPLNGDSIEEGTETIVLQLEPGSGYTVDSAAKTVTFNTADAEAGLSVFEATRFLQQATFGPTPDELARVRSLGFAAWLDAQFNRPVALHLPIMHVWYAERSDGTVNDNTAVGVEHRMDAFWRQSMRDDADSDPLRQRVAFALSQIFVISDRMSSLNNDQRGMADYYDQLLTRAFGTYRQLLEGVTRHPWMGLYLSALRNRKANPAINRYPDENYAREVMQLFSIGLWRLNQDGTYYLSDGTDLDPDGNVVAAGHPIPTYGQSQISVLARVFTGMSYSMKFTSSTDATELPTTSITNGIRVPWRQMRMFDVEHDLDAKHIWLPGAAAIDLPARTANGSAAGDADLAAALDYLANHPNTAPFISRILIQRLVTSNPTADYVARISAVFANNGSGVRGDLQAVVRAILLDPEARDFASTEDLEHGQLREPYTRYVSVARALGVAPSDPTDGGRYRGFQGIDADFLQRPLSAPSVFNFYQISYAPPGQITDAGLVAPEFQILNSVTSITGPNRFSSAFNATSATGPTQFNSNSQSDNAATTDVNESLRNSRMNESVWLPLARLANPDSLVSSLARTLCSRPLTPGTFRAITRAVNRLADPQGTTDLTVRDQRASHRLRVAAHLIAIAPESAVLR